MSSSHVSANPLSLEAKAAIGLFVVCLAAFVAESQLTQVCIRHIAIISAFKHVLSLVCTKRFRLSPTLPHLVSIRALVPFPKCIS